MLEKEPLIYVGQLYLNSELNEYLIVTNSFKGYISYAGLGFNGKAEATAFLDRFEPVDPIDVSADDLKVLLPLSPGITKASIGAIRE